MRLTYRRNVSKKEQAIRLPAGGVLLVLAASGLFHPLWAALLALGGFGLLESAFTRY